MNEEPTSDPRTKAPAQSLTDDDWMPFGKYAAGRRDQRKLKDVPPSFLLWLWDERLHREQETPLGRYVKNAYKALCIDSDYIPKRDKDGQRARG